MTGKLKKKNTQHKTL